MNKSADCPHWPFQIEIDRTIEINNYSYYIFRIFFNVTGVPENYSSWDQNRSIDLLKVKFGEVFKKLDSTEVMSHKMETILWSDAFNMQFIKDYPWISGGIFGTSTLIIMAMLYCFCCFNKQNGGNGQLEATTNPSAVVNVNIGNSSMSLKGSLKYPWAQMEELDALQPSAPNPAVSFDRRYSNHSMKSFKLYNSIRPPTPAPSRKTSLLSLPPSIKSNTLEYEKLKAEPKPIRFPSLKRSLSTLSLPAWKIKEFFKASKNQIPGSLSSWSILKERMDDPIQRIKFRLGEHVGH